MANFNRWFNYAKARFEATFAQGNRELDELEAQRAAEVADKPWLTATGDAPTFDEAKARIEWEAEDSARRAREASGARSQPSETMAPGRSGGGTEAPGGAHVGGAITSPEDRAAAADAASARLEMEARQKESAARLDAIRAELGIDPPDDQTQGDD